MTVVLILYIIGMWLIAVTGSRLAEHPTEADRKNDYGEN